MQVDLVHGQDLALAAAAAAAFDTKDRPKARLAQRDGDPLTLSRQGLREPDAVGRFTLAGWGGVDRRDQHQLAMRSPARLLLD